MSNGAVVDQFAATLDLNLVITDRNVLGYLSQFPDDEIQVEKAIEALKVGVIAIQSASPTLDTTVVQSQFAEMETRMRDSISEFQRNVKQDLQRYFEEDDGVVPRSIDGFIGGDGSLTQTFRIFFDPTEGRVSRLLQAHIGPDSAFGRSLDPENKRGIIAVIEARVHELVEAKLDEVLEQFSLDADGSAMSRLNKMLSDAFGQINQSLNIKAATAAEIEKGHVKGIEFERDLYDVFAEMGRSIGDETELVRGTPGAINRCKKGDFIAKLGETSGAPGLELTVEVKNQPMRLKDAINELQEAKENRKAAVGIFAFARGCEPPEVGDFRRIGEDFYVTVDKDDLTASRPLLYLESAYKIARALAVAAARKESAGELDLQKIHDELNALDAWSEKIADMATKAKTIQNNGKVIEQCAIDLKQELRSRITTILNTLKQGSMAS